MPVVVSGFAVLGWLAGGLYWLAFTVLFALCAATANVWVLLVAVVRDERYRPVDDEPGQSRPARGAPTFKPTCALFAERDDAERQQREAQQRHEEELAEQAAANSPRRGVPADLVPDGVSPAAAMLQAAKEAEPKRRTVLEEALANSDSLTYHPVRDES